MPLPARGRDGKLIDVASGVGDRGDVRRGVVPSDHEDIGIARHLGARVGHRDLSLVGLRRGGIHLHECQRRRRGDGIVSRRIGLRRSRHDDDVRLRAAIGPGGEVVGGRSDRLHCALRSCG